MSANGGFTLIELILVTVIIGILAGMVVLNFSGVATEASIRVAKGDIRLYMNAIDRYAIEHNDRLPNSLSDLVPKYVRELNKDPWGSQYIYTKSAGNDYEVRSAGQDAQNGTADDVTHTSEHNME